MKSWWVFIFFSLGLCHAQQTITGMVKDAETKQGIPFVAVGIVGSYHGTLTNKDGSFSVTLPSINATDTIVFSAIGYETFYLLKKDIQKTITEQVVYLKPIVYDLNEVKVKPKKTFRKVLGTEKYTKNNCSAFAGKEENWKGKQVSILANNKEGVTVFLESFGFYIIKNEYTDSLQFRLMLYEVNSKGLPGKTFLRSPIIFKTGIQQGEVRVDLKPYNISYTGDFFISLECLEEKMESSKFCFAGSIKVASFFKTSVFSKWGKVKGGGADLNLKVSYIVSDK